MTSMLPPLLAILRRWVDAIRRNHGLEHATVAVLFARHGPQRLAGRATRDGFYIVGDIDAGELLACAREALDRLQRGEASLAVSPMCGTNIAVTGALTAAATMAALRHGEGNTRRRSLLDRFANASTFAMFAVVLAQPAGALLQRFVTTRPDLDGVTIEGIRTLLPGVRKITTRAAE